MGKRTSTASRYKSRKNNLVKYHLLTYRYIVFSLIKYILIIYFIYFNLNHKISKLIFSQDMAQTVIKTKQVNRRRLYFLLPFKCLKTDKTHSGQFNKTNKLKRQKRLFLYSSLWL